MATTTNGIYYPNDYNAAADIPADLKKMAESIDKNVQDNKYNDKPIKQDIQDLKDDISDIKSEQETQNDLLQRTQSALINITTPKSSNINVKDSSNLNAKIGVFGISEQETREGYNKFDYNTIEGMPGSTIKTSVNGLNVYKRTSVNPNIWPLFNLNDVLEDGKVYTMCFDIWADTQTSFNNQRFYINTATETTHNLSNITTTKQRLIANFTYTKNDSNAIIHIYPTTNETNNIYIANVMLLEATYTVENIPNYEQYGASPSPEYPAEIQNVTGDINIKIYNKNLLDLTKCGFNNCVKNDDGSIRSNINNDYYATITTSQLNDFILQNKGKNLTFSFEGISTKTISFYIPCKRANSDSDYFEATKTGNSITMQIPQDLESLSYIQIRWNRQSTPFTDITTVISNIQLELNNAKTDFVEHKEQLITFPLAQGQKLADGDYLASDRIHHVRDVYIFKAVTSLSSYNNNKYGTNVGAVNSINTSNILSDRIVGSDSAKENTGYITGSGYTVVIYGNPTDTVESFNEKFVGTKIEYPLAKEKIEAYTPEQQEAYNQLQNAQSYYNVTNVFTDNAQLVFKYIADTQTWAINLVKNEIANTNQQLLNIAGGN